MNKVCIGLIALSLAAAVPAAPRPGGLVARQIEGNPAHRGKIKHAKGLAKGLLPD